MTTTEIVILAVYLVGVVVVANCLIIYRTKKATRVREYEEPVPERYFVSWACGFFWPVLLGITLVVTTFVFLSLPAKIAVKVKKTCVDQISDAIENELRRVTHEITEKTKVKW